jgi:hypothetical protein
MIFMIIILFGDLFNFDLFYNQTPLMGFNAAITVKIMILSRYRYRPVTVPLPSRYRPVTVFGQRYP